jgi:hypothetical protein
MAKFLRIAQWNANGLAQHKDEDQLFLRHNKIDILLISETHSPLRPTSNYHNTILTTLLQVKASRFHDDDNNNNNNCNWVVTRWQWLFYT